MTMNYRLGFFRLWVIASLIYVASVAVLSFGNVKNQFEQASIDWSKFGVLSVPVACNEARGKEVVDYENGPWNKYRTNPLCWYKENTFRALYPEYKDLLSDDLANRLYAKAGIPLHPPRPWHALGVAVLFALAPPLAIFALGFALSWAFTGFTTKRAAR